MGLTDRPMLEQLAGQVIDRLELAQPLPGMERLLSQEARRNTQTYDNGEKPDMAKDTSASALAGTTVVAVPSTRNAESHSGAQTCGLTENALTVLRKRYLIKNAHGEVVETPEQMFRRVAHYVASADLNYSSSTEDMSRTEDEFCQAMVQLDFLPNSPTLMNAGRELGQLSACFVLPVLDSMESIFDAVKYTALIHKSGGGTGFSFSRLRPKSDRVGSTGGIASGPVSFMRAFDTATDVIKQGGTRRGANMAILRIDHPDILEFISAKESSKTLTNFNLSVAVDSNFMKAVEDDAEYSLVNPHDQRVVSKVKAKDIFNKIVDMAWRTGDPGIVFIDRINRDNPTPRLGAIEATNPCGEQPLLPFESCNLGSINLSKMVTDKGGRTEVDYSKLARTVHLAVHFLDNVIDMNKFPLQEIERTTKLSRKVGLGVMGFADMLIQLRVPYNSERAVAIAENVMGFITDEAFKASVSLAEKRGVFPAYEGSIYDVPGGPRVRNATRTTIAPTGTLSIIAGCSSGIEPLFALSYTRNILDGERLVEVNPYFEDAARSEGFYSAEIMKKLAEGMSLAEQNGSVPSWTKEVFVTAHDIAPEWHVRIQAAFQKHTDNAVSKTVNLPHDATREDVARIYRMAFEEGLKGITIYRDRSKESQVLTLAGAESSAPAPAAGDRISPRKRPKVTRGVTERVSTGCGNLYVTVNSDENGICEVFTSLGKAGGCASAQLEATGRLISLTLRSGVDLSSVVKHLKGIRCPNPAWDDGRAVFSCADAIATVLEKHFQGDADEGETTLVVADASPSNGGHVQNSTGQCPECATMLVFQEGCHHCPGCGYTRC
ncbi:MAG: vitamin B12-dependent ribonucleotide reductase [Chloroflexi bacterium]|nr:vitamin B12-dependent ribonucleotide reductase [Chloroflexota bacterium]